MIKTRLILPNGLDAPVVLSKPNSGDLDQGHFDVQEKRPTRIAIFTTGQRTSALKAKYNNELAKALVDNDPEFDLQAAGYIAKSAERIYLDSQGAPLYAAKIIEEVISSKNEVIETRPPREASATVGYNLPLVITKKRIPKEEAVRNHAFTDALILCHGDPIAFDPMFDLAKEIEASDMLWKIGTGKSGKKPLVLRKNGTPYNAFLEGRTRCEKYLLVLHLSSFELRRPPNE